MPGRGLLYMRGPKYERIEVADPWVGLDDDEDDEELLFSGKVAHHQWPNEHEGAVYNNGENGSGNYIELEQLIIEDGEDEELFVYDRRLLERQGSPLYKYKKFTFRKSCSDGFLGCNRKRCLCAALFTVVSVTIICLFYFLLRHQSASPVPPSPLPIVMASSSREFAVKVAGATESTVRLCDVNSDGILDIIFGYARAMSKIPDMEEYCAFLGMGVPCAGALAAMDGRNGALLWELNLESEVFAILCDHLDANEDGIKDCVIAGRLGVLYAVDITKGAIIWSADPAVTNTSWNFYQPQVVPDLDGDGVMDVVIAHGGNGDYGARETNRDANRILLLSGKTGKSLGHYLETPDGKESYSSVTVYERQDGSIYVLFGTGGETVKGSLWAVSLWDLYCHVMGHGTKCHQASRISALQSGNYIHTWGKPLKMADSGAIELIRSGSNKGVMLPTIFVDMNRDGTPDLVVSLFNGTLVVLDGTDLGMIWTTGDRYGEFETYSGPAPGHFNSDDIPDIMIRLSHGNWTAKYNSTVVLILDGRDGHILWSTRSHSNEAVMSSPLSVKGSNNKDVFVFWEQGRLNDDVEILQINDKGLLTQKDGKRDHKHRRHGDDDQFSTDDVCDHSTAPYQSELFVLSHDHATAPLRVANVEPTKYYYNVAEEKASLYSSKDTTRQRRFIESSNSSSTGFHGDGIHDKPEGAGHPDSDSALNSTISISEQTTQSNEYDHDVTTNNVKMTEGIEPGTVTRRNDLTDGSNSHKTVSSLSSLSQMQSKTGSPLNTRPSMKTMHITSPTLRTTSNVLKITSNVQKATSNTFKATSNAPKTTSNIHRTTSNIHRTTSNTPKATSNVPKTTSNAPKATSNAHKTTSNSPKTTSNTPKATSNAPKTTSNSPKPTSNMPKATSNAPKTTSNSPKTTSNTPKATSNAPKTTSNAPKTTSNTPKATSNAPKMTTNAPKTTSNAPKTTSNAPKTTSNAPKTTSNAPKATSNAPKMTTNAPKTTSNAPKTTSNAPKTTSNAPKTTSNAPKATSNAPKTSNSPKTTSNAPKATSNAPQTSLSLASLSLTPLSIHNDGNVNNHPEHNVGQHQMEDYPPMSPQDAQDENNYGGYGDMDYPLGDDDMDTINDNVTLCTMYTTSLHSTGAIADMDHDGIIDIVYLINNMAQVRDSRGSYIGTKSHTIVVKKSLVASQDFVVLDPERTFIDANVPKGTKEGGVDFDLLPEESNWMGYIGTTGDGYFDSKIYKKSLP